MELVPFPVLPLLSIAVTHQRPPMSHFFFKAIALIPTQISNKSDYDRAPSKAEIGELID